MKRREALLATAALAPLHRAWAATPGVDAPPEPGPPRPLVVPAIDQVQGPSGLRVFVVPRPGLPIVTAALYLRAGREADPQRLAGLAALTGTVLSKGSRRGDRNVPATQIAREAEALGSSLDINTTWRVTSLAMTVTTPKLEPALALLAEVAGAPLLEAQEIERARTQMADGLRVTLANPGDVAALAARRAFWGGSAFGAVTTPASLQRITRDDVLAFHGRWFRPVNGLLVLVGDIRAIDAAALAMRHFAAWQGQGPNEAPVQAASPQAIDDAGVVIEMPGAGQSGVCLAAPFAALGAADRRIGEVAAALLGGGYSARLNQEIRIKRGLSYGAFGAGESQAAGGMFFARAQTKNESALEVATVMREELLRVAREEAPPAELDARKAALIGSFARQLDTTAGVADQVASQWFQGRPLEELSRYVEQISAVTPAQVREFAAQHWSAERMRSAIAGAVAASGGGRRIAQADLDFDQPRMSRR